VSETWIGIDIGGTNIKLALVSERGQVLDRGIIETLVPEGPAAAFTRIHSAAAALARGREVAGVGVGCAGLIDVGKGVLRSSPNLSSWEGAPLGRLAKKHFDLPVTVDNDANSAAWGEVCAGGCKGANNLVFITLGTGVGGGIVSDGSIVRGASNCAGEVGHTTVDPAGPRCRCGNRGCLEAIAGSYGMIRRTRALARERRGRYLSKWIERERRPLTPALIAEAARKGDGVAKKVLREVGEALGTAVASLVNLLNPEAVIIGGGVAKSFDLLTSHVHRVVERRAFPEPASQVRIEASLLGNDASVIGAAMFARDHALRSGQTAP
jgi:glucokinase